MKTLKELEDNNEAQKLNEYCNTDNEIVHWQPVAKDVEFEKHIAKLKAMQKI